MRSNFASDNEISEKVVRFIYEVIFLGDGGLGLSEDEVLLVDFHEEAEKQFAGADIIVFPSTKSECFVEVKSAVNYAGKRLRYEKLQPLETFAQEISYLNERGVMREGWFVDTTKKTDVYAFCWFPDIRSEDESATMFSRLKGIDDIKTMELAFITTSSLRKIVTEKLNIQDGPEAYASARTQLLRHSSQMRMSNEESRKIGSLYMHLSPGLNEKPVNILLDKTVIMERSFRRYNIRNNELVESESQIKWEIIPF